MTLANAELAEEKSIRALNYSSTIRERDGDSSPSAARQPGSPFVEKRREARYQTCEAVGVNILDGENRRLQGILRDVSRSGLRVELSQPVPPGTHLEVVLYNRAIIFAEARYCQASTHSYQVGVVIEDIFYPKKDPAKDISRTFEATVLEPLAQGPIGNHASPDDVAAFLHRDLSETKTALMERHLAVCEECSNLMQSILEDVRRVLPIWDRDNTSSMKFRAGHAQ
jgi:PilZ domain-containing protein